MDGLKYDVDQVRDGFKNRDEEIVNHVFENIQDYKETLYQGNMCYIEEYSHTFLVGVVVEDILFFADGGYIDLPRYSYPISWVDKIYPILDFKRINKACGDVFFKWCFSSTKVHCVAFKLLQYMKNADINLDDVYNSSEAFHGDRDPKSNFITVLIECEDINAADFIAHMNYKLNINLVKEFLLRVCKEKDANAVNFIGKVLRDTHQYSELNNDFARYLYLGVDIKYDVNKYGYYDKKIAYDAEAQEKEYIADFMDKCFPLIEAKEIELYLLGIELKQDNEPRKI